MARRDYASENEEEFYGQGFECPGKVSLWFGAQPIGVENETDVLQDLCGVGYYDVDNQEFLTGDGEVTDYDLLRSLSYANSFFEPASRILKESNTTICWVLAQYDFAYSPERVRRQISNEISFLGVFDYEKESAGLRRGQVRDSGFNDA